MTLHLAKEVAPQAARNLNMTMVVFRMPKWPTGVYSVVEQTRGLPPEAEIVETVKPPADTRTGLLF